MLGWLAPHSSSSRGPSPQSVNRTRPIGSSGAAHPSLRVGPLAARLEAGDGANPNLTLTLTLTLTLALTLGAGGGARRAERGDHVLRLRRRLPAAVVLGVQAAPRAPQGARGRRQERHEGRKGVVTCVKCVLCGDAPAREKGSGMVSCDHVYDRRSCHSVTARKKIRSPFFMTIHNSVNSVNSLHGAGVRLLGSRAFRVVRVRVDR